MMPALLTQASTMMCPHGGTITAVPSSAHAQAAGAPLLRASDTFIVAGCSFAPVAPHPCVTVQWVFTCQRVQDASDFVLNEVSLGLCLAGDQAPQGVALILATQPGVAGL